MHRRHPMGLLAVCAIGLAAASGIRAADAIPVASTCDVLRSPTAYERTRIELHADVTAEAHGYHLWDERCPGSSIKLTLPDHSANDAKFASLMRQIMSHQARGYVEITGVFQRSQDPLESGRFEVDDVLRVRTKPVTAARGM